MEKRVGFHYFQDTDHFQTKDLSTWLPQLKSLETAWLVIQSPVNIAIPEEFVSGLIENGIQPIINFDLQVNDETRPEELRVLLSAYAKWGVKYVLFFRSPNVRSAWIEGTWAQGDLVERFLDRYMPFVRMAEQNGLISVFPPLQPGGDYWDLSFLKKVFQLVQQRRLLGFSSNLHMAVSAQTFSKPLSWGSGGSSKWKTPRPYSKPELGEEDQIGFNAWQWYSELAKSMLDSNPKMFLFWFGASTTKQKTLDPALDFEQLMSIVTSPDTAGTEEPRIADQVVACCLWMLSAEATNTKESTAWFDETGQPQLKEIEDYKEQLEETRKQSVEYPVSNKVAEWMYPIDHYLLLPSYEWGVPENTLDRVRPIIRDSKPTIGFSIFEAMNARKVTVWNENGAFEEKDIDMLRQAGCLVDEQIIKSIGAEVY